MKRFQAIVFDMDGVLLDSEPLHFAALESLLDRDGLHLSREENENFIGTTSQAMFSTLIARHCLPRSVDEYIDLYDAIVVRMLAEPRPPAAGVTALIASARACGMRMAVASSSRRAWIDATLRSLSLADAFEVIVSGDDVQHSKPDPEIYLLAADRLHVPTDACLAVEDSPNGVLSAYRAGMTVLGVRTPYTAQLSLEGATRVVDSLADLHLPGDLHNGWLAPD